ncbi:MAG TPA: endonuclease/exonuclease/phosphatase family protein [Tepidiformaceae bacterium]|nr:endonuclease/exonuclease/phosphatase family protein [Tepidiformaceae bacterium]
MRLRLATFNIRNVTDRYEERKPLLQSAFCLLGAHIAGVQEVGFAKDTRQDDLLADCVRARGTRYLSLQSPSDHHPDFGNAILFSTGEVQVHERLSLGEGRTCQRALFALPGGRTLWFANTHLHHKPADVAIRDEQARLIVEWMADAPAADASVIVGDFNAPPSEAAYGRMKAAGYRSASLEANGAEPDVTWPSGIQAPTMDTEGEPNCLDYVWVSGAPRILSASVACNQHAPHDATLYPSDHFAVVADIDL